MGTPEFAVPFLEALAASRHQVLAVVTQPDRPRGRGHRVTPSPVKEAALRLGLPVLQPSKASDPHFLEAVADMAPDAMVLVAYGQLIPPRLLQLPPLGCINVHPSLLPRHRGASPIQAALLAGDEETGVTTMYMDEGLDTGDIILQKRLAISRDDNLETLQQKLIDLGVPLLLETLDRVEAGTAPRLPQDEERATYAPRLRKSDGQLRWEQPAVELERRIRAFTPVPGAFTRLGQRTIRVWEARAEETLDPGERGPSGQSASPPAGAEPGTILAVGERGLAVACGQGVLWLQVVQPENGRRMSGRDLANGYRIQPGQRLGGESADDRQEEEPETPKGEG